MFCSKLEPENGRFGFPVELLPTSHIFFLPARADHPLKREIVLKTKRIRELSALQTRKNITAVEVTLSASLNALIESLQNLREAKQYQSKANFGKSCGAVVLLAWDSIQPHVHYYISSVKD